MRASLLSGSPLGPTNKPDLSAHLLSMRETISVMHTSLESFLEAGGAGLGGAGTCCPDASWTAEQHMHSTNSAMRTQRAMLPCSIQQRKSVCCWAAL